MRKKADQPFRGQCIEGAVSYENVRDTIEWLPKVNANLFMIQQIVVLIKFPFSKGKRKDKKGLSQTHCDSPFLMNITKAIICYIFAVSGTRVKFSALKLRNIQYPSPFSLAERAIASAAIPQSMARLVSGSVFVIKRNFCG